MLKKTSIHAHLPHTTAEIQAKQASKRAKQPAFWQQLYQTINELFNFNLPEFQSFLHTAIKWLILGTLVGILAGTASAIFLTSLAWATDIRMAHPQLLLLLPVAGFIVGWVYWRFGGTASKGNNLVIEEVNHNQSRIPLRMAPFVLMGTIVTHFFGGSAGREGTAVQMGASLADSLQRLLRLSLTDRRLMIMAGISGGFGSVFGVPAAGFIFGMEVQNVGRIRYEGIIPCMVASFVGDYITRWLGAHHSHYPHMMGMSVHPVLMLKVAIAGIAFGLTSMLFIELIHGIKYFLRRITSWTPLYPVIGGIALIVMTILVGTTDYLGLSLSLIQKSMDGTGVMTFAFLLKLLFTTVTLGTGYYGGEVTPLLVIGSTLGFTMGRLLGVDPIFMASIGLVAVFAGASNTPLASAIMGIELVGGDAALYLFLGCTVAYLASGHRGIYATQPVAFPKSFGFKVQTGENLQAIAARQTGWLPPILGMSKKFGSPLEIAPASPNPIVTPDNQPTLADISLEQAYTIAPKTPLHEVVHMMLSHHIKRIIVLDKNQVVGILTESDLMQRIPNEERQLFMDVLQRKVSIQKVNFSQIAGDVMTTPVITLKINTPIYTALQWLIENQIKRIPVISDEGQLQGMVGRAGILKILSDEKTHQNNTILDKK